MLGRLTLWPFLVGATELLCVHQIQPSVTDPRRFASEGVDPHFRLKRRLPRGWYMLEVLVDLPSAACAARVYYDEGAGETEANCYSLPVRSGRMAKRVIFLPAKATVRFDPCQRAGEFALRHFRIVRLADWAARGHLVKKLDRPEICPDPKALPDPVLWKTYDRLFESRTPGRRLPYADWVAEVEPLTLPTPDQQRGAMVHWHLQPTVSVLVPTFNPQAEHLRACLDSVLAQSYPHWELCIADDASTEPHVHAILEEYAARDGRIRVALREQNGHIVAASNSALELTRGEFVALLDHDDTLAPHALYAVVEALQNRPGAQLVYSDEDKLDANGERCDPYFKPRFSPDLLYSQNYIGHLSVFRRNLVERVGGFRERTDGSQDYDLVLRCVAEIADPADIVHVPSVLYHWRKLEGSTSSGHIHKDYAATSALHALQAHVGAHHGSVRVVMIEPGLYRAQWPMPDPLPLVTLIVPTRDRVDLLRTCIESVLQKTRYPAYEILVVDNQSTCPETLEYLRSISQHGNVRVLHYDQPFNYSAINNAAAREANGSILGLLNNDIEVIGTDWLDEMVRHVVRSDIGCVGAKLYYPDDTLQHGGVVLGIGGVAGHSHKYVAREDGGYFSRLRIVHNVSAVTGAALLVRRTVFDEVGGLDAADLPVSFNDVDLCLKCLSAGYRNLWTPFAELYHHESKSRGADDTPEKQARALAEAQVMKERWGALLRDDPYYNRNLSLVSEDYSLSTTARPLRG